MIALCFALIFECHPIAKFWDPLIEGKCVDVPGLYLANGILNVVADFLVLLVPIPMLVTLHVSTRHKVILAAVFAMGSSCVGLLLQPSLSVDCYSSTRNAFQNYLIHPLFNRTCIIAAVRIYYVAKLLKSEDISRGVVIPTSLGVAETNLAVICACLMVLRPFLRKHLPFLLGGDTSYQRRRHHLDGLDYNTGTTRNTLDPTSASHSYETNVSAGSGKHKTWLGRNVGAKTTSGGSEDTAVGDEDLEMGGLASAKGGKERTWPLRVQKSYAVQSARAPRSESKEKIIDGMPGKPHIEE